MKKVIRIGDFELSDTSSVFIIAELSANHNGSLDQALAHIKAAKKCGADAIKLQTYTADTITINVRSDDFKLAQGTLWDGKYLYDLYNEAFTPWEWHRHLFDCAREEGLICFSSPFDPTAVDFLESLNTPAYKIASFEITDLPLIKYAASKGKPMIISTGISTSDDIEMAVNACRRVGNDQIILLKCTSSYPAPINEANLVMIRDLEARYNVFAGLSDHTLGITVPVVSTALGAKVIEKHFIIDRSLGGPDAAFSLDQSEFTEMVQAVREAESAVGKVDYKLTEKQQAGRSFSRSLYVVRDMRKGDVFTHENIRSIRPGYGMHPKYYQDVLGKIASKDILMGERLSFDMIEGGRP